MIALSLLLSWLMFGQGPTRRTDVDVPGLGVKLRPGWRLLMENGCRYSVPATWTVSADGASAMAPDGSSLIVRAVRNPKKSAYQAPTPRPRDRVAIVHEDTDHRVWLEYDGEEWREHHITVGAGRVACVAILEVREAAVNAREVARIIAESIGPAPDRWPPSSR